MLALNAALLSVPHAPREGAGATATLNQPGSESAGHKYEAAGEGLRNWLVHDNELVKDDNLELHDMFREHRRTRLAGSTGALALRKQTTTKPGCAASCEGRIQENGVFKSYLFYDDDSRAGLSDRAWGIAHVMALANSLCARPAVKSPSEVLTLPHNGNKTIPEQWWWTRYFSGVESLLSYYHHGNEGHSTCPPKGANTTQHRLNRLVDGKQTAVVGPSADEADVTRDLAQAAASTKPFSWCLGYNIRSYLGAGGFAEKKGKPDVPHDWCTMPEAWLGGNKDDTPSKGEMALGPSLLVEDLALRVTSKLGLAHWDVPEVEKPAEAPWKWPWDPEDTEHAAEGFAPGGPRVVLADSITNWGTTKPQHATKPKHATKPQHATKPHVFKPKPLSPAVAAATKIIEEAADVIAKVTKAQAQRVARGTECHLQCKEAERRALKDARQKSQAAQKKLREIQKEEEQAQKAAERAEQNVEKAMEREEEKRDRDAARAAKAMEKETRQGLRDEEKKVAIDREKAKVQAAEARRDPLAHSNVRSRAVAVKNGQCTAHHGEDKPCCGQDFFDHRVPKDVLPCPKETPVCFEYKYGEHYGDCTSLSNLTKIQAKKQAQKEVCSGPKCHGWEPAADGPCTAHHGDDKPCCGQDKLDSRDVHIVTNTDIRPCPEDAPVCFNYKYGHHAGTCKAMSQLTKHQVKTLANSEGCSGPACERWRAAVRGPCTAHYGDEKPCCGQDGLDPRHSTDKDVRPCPSRAPVCFDYKYGKHTGRCVVQSELTKAEVKQQAKDEEMAEKMAEEKRAATEPSLKLARAEASAQANSEFDWPWEEHPWGPTEEEQRRDAEEERKRNYKHLTEVTDGRCTADHGQTVPCCGQVDTRDVPDVRPCPYTEPTCSGYKLGHAMGKCEKAHAGSDQDKWVYVLHVKRSASDAKPGSYCHNPVKAVKEYMSCEAAGGTKPANHTLIVFTDDSNKGYVDSLLKGLGKLPRWGGGIVHGDRLVRELLDEPDQTDNYLVYSVASLLMARADQFFAMERCGAPSGGQTDCSNIRPASLVRESY